MSLTHGAHAQRGCVCVHPTSFICPTNDTTYLTGNEGQKFAVFSENAPLQSWSACSILYYC